MVSSMASMSQTMNLFDDVCYHLASSLPPQRTAELSHVLDINGARQAESIDDNTLTHFITNSNRYERWQDVAAREEAGELIVVTVGINTIYILRNFDLVRVNRINGSIGR
jgi:hypothetical protein